MRISRTFWWGQLSRKWPVAQISRAIRLRVSSISLFSGKTEKSFRTAFSMLPLGRRNDLIAYYQRKHSCARSQAMRRAIEDRARDNGYRM